MRSGGGGSHARRALWLWRDALQSWRMKKVALLFPPTSAMNTHVGLVPSPLCLHVMSTTIHPGTGSTALRTSLGAAGWLPVCSRRSGTDCWQACGCSEGWHPWWWQRRCAWGQALALRRQARSSSGKGPGAA